MADKDGLGNKLKNRNIDDIVLEWLSGWHHWVLIFRLQHVGMSWGAAYHWGALLTECDSDLQQVRSTPKSRLSALPSAWSVCRLGYWLAVEVGTCQNLESCREGCKIDKSIQRKENKIATRAQSFKARVGSSKKFLMVHDTCQICVIDALHELVGLH